MHTTFQSDVDDPQTTTPARAVPSARRTSHVDISFADDEIVLDGRCRDLVTAATTQVHAEATLAARLGGDHTLRALTVSAEQDAATSLVGAGVGRGFRGRLAAVLPTPPGGTTPLIMLLDELPVAALISGYALMYRGALGDRQVDAAGFKSDICSGWAADGFMVTEIRRTGRMPIPVGPAAPELAPGDDEWAWHELRPLASGAMRRRRLLDLSRSDDGVLAVFAMFRDTHVGEDGIEAVLHEYSLTARLDPTTGTVSDCVARPRVLPWNECPSAAASASRLDGLDLAAVRATVSREFRGLGTCTHLNDLLRSLGDLDVLAGLVAAA